MVVVTDEWSPDSDLLCPTTPGRALNLSHNDVEKILERIFCLKKVETVRKSRLLRTRRSIPLFSVTIESTPEDERAATNDTVAQACAVNMALIAESSYRSFSLQTVLEIPAKGSTKAMITT